MIWDSIFFMTLIDLTVITGFIFVLGYFLKKNPHFSWKKAKRGFLALFIGLGMIALLFFGDLFTMHILPWFIPEPQAMALMKNLHGEYLWFIVPPGVLFLITGLVLIITRYGQNVSLLEDSQEQFRMLADNANDLIIIHDEKGNRLYVSPAIKRHLGLSLKDLEGKPAWFLVHPREREKVYKEWLQRIFVEKKSHKVRIRMKHADGHYVWFENVSEPVIDETGKVKAAVSISRNITEQREAEEIAELAKRDLQDREQFQHTIMDTMVDGLMVLNTRGKILSVNKSAAKMFGYSRKELVGLSLPNLMLKSERESYEKHRADYLKTIRRSLIRQGRNEAEGLRKDGKKIAVEIAFKSAFESGRRVFVASIVDITDRKEAESKFRLLAENANDIIILRDAATKVIYVSPSYKKHLGRNPKNMLGTRIGQRLIHPDDKGILKDWKKTVFREGKHFMAVVRLEARDGKYIWFESETEPIKDEHGKVTGSVTISRNFTQQKEEEDQRIQLGRVLDNSPNEVYMSDLKTGKFVFANKTACKNLGYTHAELTKLSPFVINLSMKGNPEVLANAIKPMQKGKKEKNKMEGVHIRKDGSTYQVEITLQLSEFKNKPVVVGIVEDITLKKEAEEKFRLVAEHANDIITLRDANTKVLYVSPSYEKHLGRSPGEYMGTTFETMPVHPDEKSLFRTWQKQVFKKGKPFIGVFRVKAQSGKYIWFESETEPIKDELGKVTGSVTISRNFTQQKEEEDRRVQLGRILDNSLNEIYISDLKTLRYVFANQAARKNLGYSLEELQKMTPLDTSQVLKEQPELLAKRLKPLQTGKKEKERFESIFIRKDGSIYATEVTLQLSEMDNKPVIVANVEDISIRKEEEDKRVQLGRILDNSLNEIYISDVETFRYVFANQAARNNLGYSLEELQKMTPLDTSQVLKEQPELLAKRFEPLLTGKKEKDRYESIFIRKDGSTYATEVTLQLSEFDNKPVIVANVEDISIKKETAAQLRQAQKMEAVGQLTGGIAHDFNNLLTAMQGGIRLAEQEDLSDLARECLEISMGAVKRGADLTRRLLAFSRTQTLKPEVVDINDLVRGFEPLLKRTLGEIIEIETVLMQEKGFVRVDVRELENSLLNLSVNARDAMPRGGHLTIEVESRKITPSEADQKDLSPGDFVILSVSDNGSGMPQEVRDNIFEPFFTTKEEGRGTGLGLSTVYGFVKQSGGHVTVYSELGVGTTFRLYLPKTKEQKVVKAKKTKAGISHQKATGKILLVEDNDEVRAFVAKALGTKGYSVLEAEHGPGALKLMNKNSDIDLLLTDIVLPKGMDGVEVGKRFKKKFPGSAVIYSSGFTTKAIEKNGFLKEGEEMLSKPYDMTELYERVSSGMQTNKP